MSGEMGNLVVKVNMKKSVEEGLMMASTELLEAWVSSGKTYFISGKANGVLQVASVLSRLVYCYPSYLDELSAKISLSQGGRLMGKILGETN
jgi:hypothetical protein